MSGRVTELVGFLSCWMWRVDREERVNNDTQYVVSRYTTYLLYAQLLEFSVGCATCVTNCSSSGMV